uniref:ATP-dependent Clp protease proteolytic subunit n=1 Tax=Drosera erythrorhiza TaxID=2005751 RepID=A0A385KN73_9CARY|nr:ClpP [Drosera erythrorhiza]
MTIRRRRRSRNREREKVQIPYYVNIPQLKPDDPAWKFGGWSNLRKMIKRYRLLVLARDITSCSASKLQSTMLYLACNEDYEAPVHLVIDSYGGHASAALGIVAVMKYVRTPIYTSCMGFALSMAALVVIAGLMGGRTIYPNSFMLLRRLHMKEPKVAQYDYNNRWMSMEDLSVHLKTMKQLEYYVQDGLASWTGKTMEEIGELMDEEALLTADMAVVIHELVDDIGTKQSMCQIVDDTINQYRPSVDEIERMNKLRELREEQEREEERLRNYADDEPLDSGGGDGGAEMEPA